MAVRVLMNLPSLTIAALVLATTVAANEPASPGGAAAGDDRPVFLQVGGGMFDVKDDDRSVAFNLEARASRALGPISPGIGLLANVEGGLYGYFGLFWDLTLGPVSIMPGLGAGYYRQGDSKDLGGPFAFRQSLDVAFRFPGDWRLGVRIAHISNASIYENNPGQEDLQLTLAVPIGSGLGR